MTNTSRFLLVLLLVATSPSLLAQSVEYLPGLVSTMTLADGSTAQRVDAMCDWQWDSPAMYDERLTSDQACRIVWRGALHIKAAGKYQLANPLPRAGRGFH